MKFKTILNDAGVVLGTAYVMFSCGFTGLVFGKAVFSYLS